MIDQPCEGLHRLSPPGRLLFLEESLDFVHQSVAHSWLSLVMGDPPYEGTADFTFREPIRSARSAAPRPLYWPGGLRLSTLRGGELSLGDWSAARAVYVRRRAPRARPPGGSPPDEL